MDLNLSKIDAYFNGLDRKGDLKGVEVKFPEGWEIIPNEKILFQINPDRSILFYTSQKEVSFEDMVDYIYNVTINNQEKEEKTNLKNEYIDIINSSFEKINAQINELFNENNMENIKKILKKNKNNFSKLEDFKLFTGNNNNITKENESSNQ